MQTSSRCTQRGITLVQVLITVAIVAALALLSTNGFDQLVERQRSSAARQAFHSLFHFARTRAIHTNKAVTVCALTAENRCTRNWGGDRRIAVFHDLNRNRELDPDDEALRLLDWPSRRGNIRWRASLARPFIDFQPEGNTWQNGTLFYCPASGNVRHGTALVLSHAGRTYRPGDSNGDGIDEDREQRPVQCPA